MGGVGLKLCRAWALLLVCRIEERGGEVPQSGNQQGEEGEGEDYDHFRRRRLQGTRPLGEVIKRVVGVKCELEFVDYSKFNGKVVEVLRK